MICKYNKDIAFDILRAMPAERKAVLVKALERNLILTSSWVLSSCTVTVYHEGFLVKLEGTRCSFQVYAKDNDGEYEVMRKPVESKLHKIYDDWFSPNESDFDEFK